jgi:hypothetical protein
MSARRYRPAVPDGENPAHGLRRSGWLPLAIYVAGAGSSLGLSYRTDGMITLAIIELVVPAVFAMVVLIAVLFGDDRTCERTFRLLRWIAHQPEPPGPPPVAPASEQGSPADGCCPLDPAPSSHQSTPA